MTACSYANLFTPDAVFRQPRTEGRQNLATMASRAPHGPKYTRHFLANHVIEATADGAVGKQYLVAVDIGEIGTAELDLPRRPLRGRLREDAGRLAFQDADVHRLGDRRRRRNDE